MIQISFGLLRWFVRVFLSFSTGTLSPSRARRQARRLLGVVGVAATLGLWGCSDEPQVDEGTGGESPVGSGGRGGIVVVGPGGTGPIEPEPEVPWTCGDGTLEPGELCDDGNERGGDGCSADCQNQNPDYECLVPGKPCVRIVTCGNGEVEGLEACDDGNVADGDGCAADCLAVEDGYACGRPGTRCLEVPVCGDGALQRGEQCDPGPGSDPGCISCQLTAGYWCLVAGQPCVEQECGNGVRTPDEACDDGGKASGDGCSPSCAVESGWRCNTTGCREICGDGKKVGAETCDDSQALPQNGDGCSAGCRVEPGFSCSGTGASSCKQAVCSNGLVEPGEGCDDGNQVAGDGCGPTCQNEPIFDPDGVAVLVCGDGLVTGGEECDDGNKSSGDGCDSACRVEEGFACSNEVTLPPSVDLQVTYRDFKRRADTGGHPDFEWEPNPSRRDMPGPVCRTENSAPCTAAAGAACESGTCGRLDAEGKPVFHLTGDASQRGRVTSAATFGLWYRDANSANVVGQNGKIDMWSTQDLLTLNQVNGSQSDVYSFASSSHFPLTGRGFGNTPGQTKNFHFTTELRYFFQYRGGESLVFRGDDDVWVFVNGRHAVDIGGVHGAQWGRVVLGDDGDGAASDSDCSVHGAGSSPPACELEPAEVESSDDRRFGLVKGGVYQIVLFHAERHTSASNFNLTLAGFLAPRSSCQPACGDGKVTAWEVCDDGPSNQDGVYGVCNSTCSGLEYCGDGVAQAPEEQCDNGFNLSPYESGGSNACSAGCVLPPFCGDGTLDAGFELCDDGENNQDDAYETCATTCDWGPYCGDGVLQEGFGESCDEGIGPGGNVPYGTGSGQCGLDCQEAPYCGDGERNGGEQCDAGTAMNTGAYGGCNADCTRAARCGDRKVQAGEECDAGPTGSLACSPTCRSREVITR